MLEELFNKAKDSSICNTSYPLNKESWKEYKSLNEDLFSNEKELSFYIHIPFCKSLCSFCEYIKYKKDSNLEKEYLNILEKDINKFIETHTIEKLYGFDIGGGTPTSLDIDNFKKLMNISKTINKLPHIKDYEPSIEATFNTIDEEKIRLINETGFKRISLGIQTTNTKILLENNRDIINIDRIKEIVTLIQKYNLKVNLDLMYGLPNQTKEDIKNVIKIIEIINPNQVTLYEMRYNMVNIKPKFTKEELYEFYNEFFNSFINLGYIAEFGQNTFSKTNDLGLSSYLKYRMIENIPYKGFGIAAQSKSNIGLSYNIGKNGLSFKECSIKETYYEEDKYILPPSELLAKYISISLYYGKFKLSIMENIIKEKPLIKYKKEFEYLLKNNYIEIKDDIISLTKKGFKYFGAVGALFYSNKSKEIVLGDVI